MDRLTVLLPVGPHPRPYFLATLASLAGDFPSGEGEIRVVFDGTRPTDQEQVHLERLGAGVSCIPKQSCLADVLNRGLQVIDTELVSRIDSDDLWPQGRLRSQRQLMAADPDCVLAGADAATIDAEGAPLGRLRAGHADDLRKALITRNQLLHPTVVFRSAVARRVGGYPSVGRAEDYGFWLALAREGLVRNVREDWVTYRIHPGQLSRAKVSWEALRLVSRNRRHLARVLQMGDVEATVRDLTWACAQKIPRAGVRRLWWREERNERRSVA